MSEERQAKIFGPCIDNVAGGCLAVLMMKVFHSGVWGTIGYVVFGAAVGAAIRAAWWREDA